MKRTNLASTFDFDFFNTFDVTDFPELPAYPDFLSIESKIRKFWSKNDVMDKYLLLNKNSKEIFSFFDGPITANNAMGVHHALGRTIKDAVLRYQTFIGKKLRYQNGFDCQGLWIEVEVEKSLKLNSKKDIIDYGLANFSQACQSRVDTYGELITGQSKELGQFMDWNNSYWTHTDKNIEHIWHFLGVCHKNGWLYKGHKIMPWCTRCETSLSQHEQSDSYKELVHPSIFVKFKALTKPKSLTKLLNNKDLYFLVWTTTPWTLPANVAVAVNPDLNYLFILDSSKKNMFLVGEKAFEKLKFLQSFTKVGTVLGKELVGVKLDNLTKSFVPKQQEIDVRVVQADFVSEEEGTGLVHIAPGCGVEDFELGQKLDLLFLAPLHEDGSYKEEFGFSGKNYLEVSKLVQKNLKEEDLLFKQLTLKHRYPVCWRCSQELAFRLVDEWFIKSDEIRAQLLAAVDMVTWHPYYMKDQMKNWLTNMGDWCISRNRFWGLPLPFFECSCGKVTVVSRFQELFEKAGFSSEAEFRKTIPDLHRPYVDKLTINCENCGKKVKRILSVGDCWLDAGIVPFSTLNYLENHDINSNWSKWFPADFVVEMREQIRLWFYSMLFMSVTLTGKAPYKTVMAYEKVLDEKGNAMHKSKGNAIWWSETAEKVGSDANRLFYTSWDTSKPLLYGYTNLKKSLNQFNTFWSCCRFFQQNIALSPTYWQKLDQGLSNLKLQSSLDRWLVLSLEQTNSLIHHNYGEYKLDLVRDQFDKFWTKLSTFWLRNRRDKFWSYDKDSNREESLLVYQLLWQAILLSLFWLAPIAPHVSEYLFQMLVRPFTNKFQSSIHLNDFYNPQFAHENLQLDLFNQVSELETVLEIARNLRQQAKIKNRYVLPEFYVHSEKNDKLTMLHDYWFEVLKNELNTENLYFKPFVKRKNSKYETLKKSDYVLTIPLEFSEDIQITWLQSELLRTMQFLRKKANLTSSEETFVRLEYSKIDFKDFLTEDFLKKLKTEVFVELIEEEFLTSEELKNNENWLSNKVKFDSKELLVFLKKN